MTLFIIIAAISYIVMVVTMVWQSIKYQLNGDYDATIENNLKFSSFNLIIVAFLYIFILIPVLILRMMG